MKHVLLSLALLTAAAVLPAVQDPSEDDDAPAERPIHERIDLPSVAACGGCHVEVFEEWSESLHAKAWTNANVLNATRNFEIASCRPCHSPRSVFETGFERGPRYRDFNQSDGVHCLSCHGLSDGVAAARTLPDAPCKPKYTPELMSADHCYPCHEPTHQAFEEYETSDAYAVGIRCVDCHMPPRKDRPGRSHGPHGGMNEEFVKRALAWECAVVDGEVVLHLRNRTGHKFPGEIPSRSFLVHVDFTDEQGEAAGEKVRLLLRKPHKREDREDNRLRPDEERVLRFPFPPNARRAEVKLLFKPLPLLPEEGSFLLGKWSGERG